MLRFKCISGKELTRVIFTCTFMYESYLGQPPDNLTSDINKVGEYTFYPGTTKAQACEAVFKGQNIRKK